MNLKNCSIILLIFLFSCKKENKEKISLDSGCTNAISPSSGLIGKWELKEWRMDYYNNIYCNYIDWNMYSAASNNIEVVMEITDNGVINFYFDDTLGSSFLFTGINTYNNQDYRYYIYNCGGDGMYFKKFNGEFESLSVGDSILFWGPDFNINYVFGNGAIKVITGSQKYIKIE